MNQYCRLFIITNLLGMLNDVQTGRILMSGILAVMILKTVLTSDKPNDGTTCTVCEPKYCRICGTRLPFTGE